MTLIKPVSDLRNHFSEIADICQQQDEPVFFTKNGVGNLAVMSIQAYDKLSAKIELLQKLAEAETEARNGRSAGTHKEVFGRLRAKLTK